MSRSLNCATITSCQLAKSADESLTNFITGATSLHTHLASAISLYEHQFSLSFLDALTDECNNWEMLQKTKDKLPAFNKLVKSLRLFILNH
jgi:hypothetical protein